MLRAGLLFIFLLLLSSCSPFRQPQFEPPALPDRYSQAPFEDRRLLPDRWWESFADPRLNRLQQQLLSSNLDLRQALHRLEQLEALQRSSAAGLWPSLTLAASGNREKNTGSSPQITSSRRVSLAASYEVDLWSRLHDQAEAAELRWQAGRLDTQSLMLSLTAQLAESYFSALEQRAQLRLVESQVGHYRELITTIENRYRSGLATARELYQARQNLARAEALRAQYLTGVSSAEKAISLLLGRAPGSEPVGNRSLPELDYSVAPGLPASLLIQRPDVAADLASLTAVDKELAAALAARLPAVELSATLFYSATRLASADIEGSFWALALGLTQPLFDGGRRQAEADRQQALRNEQLARTKQTLLAALKDVETALVADQNSRVRLSWLREQRRFSEQELLYSRDNYRNGLLSSQDLLSSEISYLEISSQVLAVQRQTLSSRVSLARALGGSWMQDELNRQQQTLKQAGDK